MFRRNVSVNQFWVFAQFVSVLCRIDELYDLKKIYLVPYRIALKEQIQAVFCYLSAKKQKLLAYSPCCRPNLTLVSLFKGVMIAVNINNN